MANLLHSTRFKSPATAATPFSVTIPATTAGSTLVVVAGGGATIQAKLGVGGTNFTRRTNSLSVREVVAQDIVDSSGGTTIIQIVLNGPENVDGMIFEFASGSLGSFMAGNHTESSTDSQGQASAGSVVTTGAAVILTMFTASDAINDPARGFWGLEPVGKQFANEYITPDTAKTKYFSMIGITDQATAGTYTAISSRILASQEHQSCVWAYADTSGGTPTYANPYANAVAAENSLPGSLEPSWFGFTTNPNIAGYTDSLSYAPGSTINFKVDSANVGFNLEIYRLGFYNHASFGAKRKATVAGTPAVQSAPSIDSFGGSVCAWSTTATWSIPSTATPGIYIYNMRRTDNSTFAAQGLFVVRSTVPGSFQAGKIMLKTADFTWQAYNLWGATSDSGSSTGMSGRNIYGAGSLASGGTAFTNRAFAVSYDRPFGTVSNNQATYYWDSEAALVNFLEANAYDVDYYTCVDIDANTAIPSKYGIAISSGHDEYWSTGLRDAFENARDAGTSLIFLSSNTSLWHVRFAAGDTNRRTMICYKDSADQVGYNGTTKYDPVSYTGTWRDPRTNAGGVNNPSRRPESGLTGQWFVGNGTFVDRIMVPAKYRTLPLWRNTRAANLPAITYRGSTSNSSASAVSSIVIPQPAGTQVGDLVVVALIANGDIGSIGFSAANIRRVQYSVDGSGQALMLAFYHAASAGASSGTLGWNTNRFVTVATAAYGNATWNDSVAAVTADNAGTTSHTTASLTPDDADRWAIALFGDLNNTGTNPTTGWTAGSGLTSRVATDNTANGSIPYLSLALMDTAGAVTQAAHSYSATANHAQAGASMGLLFISPATALISQSIGAEWDYVKREEPSTPTDLVMLSDQLLSLTAQAADYAGEGYANDGTYRYGLSLYKAASGALVWCAGTWRYSYGLSRFRAATYDTAGSVDVAMQQAMINIVRDMGIASPALLGTAANQDATALVDPGSAAAPSAYGLGLSASPYQNLFGTTTPTVIDNNQNTDFTLGTLLSANSNGQIYGIRWHFPGNLPNGHVIGLLYSYTNDTTGAELARVTFSDPQTGWNEALFSSPVAITAGTKYVAAVWTPDHFNTYGAQFASAATTNGHLTAPKDVVGAHNGKFLQAAGSAAFPTSSTSSNGYLADVLYIADIPAASLEYWGQLLG